MVCKQMLNLRIYHKGNKIRKLKDLGYDREYGTLTSCLLILQDTYISIINAFN